MTSADCSETPAHAVTCFLFCIPCAVLTCSCSCDYIVREISTVKALRDNRLIIRICAAPVSVCIAAIKYTIGATCACWQTSWYQQLAEEQAHSLRSVSTALGFALLVPLSGTKGHGLQLADSIREYLCLRTGVSRHQPGVIHYRARRLLQKFSRARPI